MKNQIKYQVIQTWNPDSKFTSQLVRSFRLGTKRETVQRYADRIKPVFAGDKLIVTMQAIKVVSQKRRRLAPRK